MDRARGRGLGTVASRAMVPYGLGRRGSVRRVRRVDGACVNLVAELGAQPGGAVPGYVLLRPAAARARAPPGPRASGEAHGQRRRGSRDSSCLRGSGLATEAGPVPGRRPDGLVPSRHRGSARLAFELLERAGGVAGARPAAAARDRHVGADAMGAGGLGGGDPDRDAVQLPDRSPGAARLRLVSACSRSSR